MKKTVKNQVQKLFLREVCGSLQPFSRSNPVRFFTKYSPKCCFKLGDILDEAGEIQNGYVILGFTKDGTHLISYSLVINTGLDLPQPVYTYMLHWWKFQYSKPLVKVQSTHLFYDQPISHALHLIVSQSLDEKQVIVWGRGPTSREEQSCKCYVTICAAPPAKPCQKCKENPRKPCYEHCYSAHFMYDSLPPYPVFLPSTCLQIPGTVFFNSGDALVAFKCAPCANDSELEIAIHEFKNPSEVERVSPTRRYNYDELENNIYKESTRNTKSQCDVNLDSDRDVLDQESIQIICGESSSQEEELICQETYPTESIQGRHVDELSVNSTSPQVLVMSVSPSEARTIYSDYNDNDCDSLTMYSYRRFATCDVQDNALDIDDDINREVPAIVIHGTEEMESTLCLESSSTAYSSTSSPSILVCQAFLDMEQCINELIESHEDLRHRYKSLRDYDSQVLSVCDVTGDVIVMVNILVYAKPTRSSLSDGLQVSPSPLLQQTGFIFSWNVWNGTLRTLYCLEMKDHPHGKSFTKSESTLERTRSLRQKTTVPAGFSSQVRVFSNYTVFTEKSLKYLIHPYLPIIILL